VYPARATVSPCVSGAASWLLVGSFLSSASYIERLDGETWRCAVRLELQPLYPPSQPPLLRSIPTRRPLGRGNASIFVASPLLFHSAPWYHLCHPESLNPNFVAVLSHSLFFAFSRSLSFFLLRVVFSKSCPSCFRLPLHGTQSAKRTPAER